MDVRKQSRQPWALPQDSLSVTGQQQKHKRNAPFIQNTITSSAKENNHFPLEKIAPKIN